MAIKNGWYGRKVTVTMTLLILAIAAALGLKRISFGGTEGSGSRILSVIIEHYGIDSFEMERRICVPLEEELSGLAGISNMRSRSEYGKIRIDCSLKKYYSHEKIYLAVRDGVDRVYEHLPDSVQKPRIVTGSSTRRPVFIVAFHPVETGYTMEELRSYIEKEVKPLFQRIDGTGEIEVGGGSIGEIHVETDPGKTAAAGISAGEIAELLQRSLVLLPSGYISTSDEEIAVSMRGIPDSIDEIGELNIGLSGGALVPLSSLATVRYGFREPETISRVDGGRRIVLYIRSNGNTNIAVLGKGYTEIVKSLRIDGVETEIIFNGGARVQKSLRQMLFAVLLGMAFVALLLAATARELRRIIVLTCFLPLSLGFSSALLAAFSVDFDHYTLAGFALGLGLIIDIGIVLSAHLRSRSHSRAFSAEHGRAAAASYGPAVRQIIRPLLSSTLTTLVVLIPFFFIKDTVPGSLQIASSVSVLIATALCLALLFMPVYLFPRKGRSVMKIAGGTAERKNGIRNRSPLPDKRPAPHFHGLKRKVLRFLYGTVSLFAKKRILLLSAAVLIGSACLAGASMGRDFTDIWSEEVLFGHIEFESGTTLAAVDKGLTVLSNAVESLPGVETVETIARRGNGEISIRFDGEKSDKAILIRDIGEIARGIPNCFVYFPEKTERGERTLEITLSGDEQQLLKTLAHTTAARLREVESVKGVVLHFKEDPPAYIFQVDHAQSTYSGVLPRQIAESLRWNIYGPVALKWMDREREIDLRIMGEKKDSFSRADLSALSVSTGRGTVLPILRLGRFIETTEASKIYRENKRRAVYFTVHSIDRNIEEMLETIWDVLDAVELPDGYAFRMDKKIYEFQERFRNLVLLLILVVVLVFMVLASQFESFIYPLIIISVIPISLSFPIIGLFVTGGSLNVPVLIGLIIMTGVIVNNGILIADSIRHREFAPDTTKAGKQPGGIHREGTAASREVTVPAIISAIRKRLEALLLTSLTTILGTVPLFFVSGEGSGFMKSIAFVVIFGMTGAVVVTFTFLPALLSFAQPLTVYFFGGKKNRNRIY